MPLPPAAQPIPTDEAQRFYLRSLPFPTLPCTPLYTAPVRTGKRSATKPAEATMLAVRDQAEGLKKLWICETMWTRLYAYINLSSLIAHKDDDSVKEPLFHASDCPNAPELPPPSYTDGYRTMNALESIQSVKCHPPLCNIEGVQDAVNSQILDVINAGLQMRYGNNISTLDEEPVYLDSKNHGVAVDDVKSHCFYPAWQRSCRKNHINRGSNTAGFTDKMLFLSPAELDKDHPKRTQVALHEGKPPWVYHTEQYQDILGGEGYVINEDGEFNVEETSHPGNLLLKQLWGECTDLGPDVGFTTNCDVVMIFFRVVPPKPSKSEQDSAGLSPYSLKKRQASAPKVVESNSGFVLSPLMQWTDPRLRACLLSLSFLAIDEQSWKNQENPITLRDILCPESECKQIINP